MSVRPSVSPSVSHYFQTTKNVISRVPMTTKFDMDQERVQDNSKMTSECWSVSLSVHPTQKRNKERKKEKEKEGKKAKMNKQIKTNIQLKEFNRLPNVTENLVLYRRTFVKGVFIKTLFDYT